MDVVDFLVAADGVHIGVKAPALVESVPLESETLPLREGVDDLRLGPDGRDVEGDGSFVPVEIVVETGVLSYEKRRGNALERKRVAERVAEYYFDEFDGALRIVTVEARRVPFGDYAV